jgi:hypothetical protein
VVDPHGAHAERRGQRAVCRADAAARREVGELIAGPEALDDVGLERGGVGFGADELVAVAGRIGQAVEQRVTAKSRGRG